MEFICKMSDYFIIGLTSGNNACEFHVSTLFIWPGNGRHLLASFVDNSRFSRRNWNKKKHGGIYISNKTDS